MTRIRISNTSRSCYARLEQIQAVWAAVSRDGSLSIRLISQQTGIVLSLAEIVAIKYEVALTLIQSGKPHLVRKGEVLEREYAEQLRRLASYADEIL